MGTIEGEKAMRRSPRIWFQGFLVGALLATQTGVVGAQIPDPTTTGVQVPNPIETVDAAVQDAINAVTNTVTDTTTTVENTVNQTTNTVENTADSTQTVTGSDPEGTAGDTVGTVTGASNTVTGATGGGIQQKEAGGTAGSSPSGSSGSTVLSQRAYTAAMAGSLQNWVRARGLFNSAAMLAGAQPSLAIFVDAVNDADGDGIFSDEENAPAPNTDVTFKALITNIGSTGFEIAGVNHTYTGATGPSQEKVCGELTGIILAPGESLACTFPVADYAPARGESLVNTVMAAAFEFGKGARRGASDSDTSTVDTVVPGDEVLAVAIKRNLAFTGTDAARLLALALVLLAAGGGLMSLGRLRSRRLIAQLPSESSVEFLTWWSARPGVARSKEKSHTK
jgi:hypothetical protein